MDIQEFVNIVSVIDNQFVVDKSELYKEVKTYFKEEKELEDIEEDFLKNVLSLFGFEKTVKLFGNIYDGINNPSVLDMLANCFGTEKTKEWLNSINFFKRPKVKEILSLYEADNEEVKNSMKTLLMLMDAEDFKKKTKTILETEFCNTLHCLDVSCLRIQGKNHDKTTDEIERLFLIKDYIITEKMERSYNFFVKKNYKYLKNNVKRKLRLVKKGKNGYIKEVKLLLPMLNEKDRKRLGNKLLVMVL